MHEDCKDWDYKKHPAVSTVEKTCREFELQIRKRPNSQSHALVNTKRFHRAMFKAVTPPGCDYLAGNFRGSKYPCLEHRPAYMSDRKGAPSDQVESLMATFHANVRLLAATLDTMHVEQGASERFLEALVRFIANVVSRFQDIHPYADGNGHIGRLLVWVITGRYGLVPVRWWLHEDPGLEWHERVRKHQRGDTDPLEEFLLTTLFQ